MSQSLIIRFIVQQVYLEKTLDATPVPPPPRVPRRAPLTPHHDVMRTPRPSVLCTPSRAVLPHAHEVHPRGCPSLSQGAPP